MSKGPFGLKRPCGNCPFRTDVEPYIRPDRAKEIADSLREDAEFPCHKTTTHREGDEGEQVYVRDQKVKFCAGALITMENEGYSNGSVRLAERLGMFDPSNLDMSSPVHPSLSAWVRSFSPAKTVEVEFNGVVEVLEYEHCGYVGEDCEDPAGYMFGGGVADNDDEPTCHPEDDACFECGTPICSACRSTHPDGQPWCPDCAGEE